MKTLVFSKSALKNNISVVKERAGGAVIYAVLTGDAYGAGLLELARLLRDEGINHFAVMEPEDAARLRKAGFVHEEILMLRSTTDKEELERLMDLNVVCTIGSYDTGLALNGMAERRATVAEAHIQIDSGMGYGGFLLDEPEKLLSIYQYLPNVAISGTYTQFHAVGHDAEQKLDAFLDMTGRIQKAGFETGILHAAGSSLLMTQEDSRLDAVRAGSVFLGRCTRRKGDGLQTVGYGEATLDEIRWLPKGHTVGNETPVTVKKPTRVAVIPVGYQNGFGVRHEKKPGLWAAIRAWRARRRITVRVGGKKVKVLGGIGACETVINVTDMKCSAGDVATFDIDPMFARGMKREYR